MNPEEIISRLIHRDGIETAWPSGVERWNEAAALKRLGRPEEIAGPMVFLVSQLASFMSGQTLVVDGGTQAHFPHTGANPMDEK